LNDSLFKTSLVSRLFLLILILIISTGSLNLYTITKLSESGSRTKQVIKTVVALNQLLEDTRNIQDESLYWVMSHLNEEDVLEQFSMVLENLEQNLDTLSSLAKGYEETSAFEQFSVIIKHYINLCRNTIDSSISMNDKLRNYEEAENVFLIIERTSGELIKMEIGIMQIEADYFEEATRNSKVIILILLFLIIMACLAGGIFFINRLSHGVFTEILSHKDAADKAYYHATHDSLTGIKNRKYLEEYIHNHLTDKNPRPFALLMLDLNDFKLVNDTFGHEYGDEVLAIVAHRLCTSVRDNDLVCRIGGDEFVIILFTDNRDVILNIVSRMHLDIKKVMNVKDQQLRISSSVGISFFPEDGRTYSTLFKKADDAMYDAKQKKTT
jgi:diguanylate cyclase (GGDEF)-like protein